MRLDPASGVKLDEGLSLAESYELCRKIQKAHSRTYYFSTGFFPPHVRPRVHALYAFMRYADEIVDNPGVTSLGEQLGGLEAFERETMAAVAGEPVANPVLRAYADTVRVCGIDPETIAAFMRSMKMDTRVFRYPTYRDLEVYTYGSAAVVGLMMCRVVGAADRRADRHAEALGVAMQLSNFLRDVGEDWRRGRVYLPLEDLERFGVSEAEVLEGVSSPRMQDLLRFQIARAHQLYDESWRGIGLLHPDSRFAVATAATVYRGILEKIEANNYNVFTRRASLSAAEKLTTLPQIVWRLRGLNREFRTSDWGK